MLLEKRVPRTCRTCDKGEDLIQYTIAANGDCTITCQTNLGKSEAFSGAIASVAIAVTAGLFGWFSGYIRRNTGGNRRWDQGSSRARGLEEDALWNDYQRVQWTDTDDNHPYIFQGEDHTILVAANGTLLQQFDGLFTKSGAQKRMQLISWSDVHSTLDDEALEKRDDARGVSGIEWEWTSYNFNGHDPHPDPTIADKDLNDILYGMTSRFRNYKRKVECVCGYDTAYGGQAFKITMAASMGNGQFQKYDCGSCAVGGIIPNK